MLERLIESTLHAQEKFEKAQKTRLRANGASQTSKCTFHEATKAINMTDFVNIFENMWRQFGSFDRHFDHFMISVKITVILNLIQFH